MTQKSEPTNSEMLLREILLLDANVCEVQLCLASLSEDDTPDIQRVQISKGVANEFRKVINKVLARRKKDSDKGNLVLREYDVQAKLDSHEVEHIDLSIHVTIKNQFRALADITSMDVFQEDKDFVDNLRFYVIVLRPKQSDPVLFFRIYTPKKELHRSALFGIVLRQGTYDRFTEKLFMFDQHIDCITSKESMYIFNKNNFQKIFRFYEMLIAEATQTLNIIEQRIPIDDYVSFRAACEGHHQKLAKLKNIASKPYIQQITMDDLKKVIHKYGLPIQTVGQGLGEQIKFDASDKWAILRLLDDDYLESIMTGVSYEVNSKRAL